MKQLLAILLLSSTALAAQCDPNGRQPQLACFDGDESNGEIHSVESKHCGVDSRTGQAICDASDVCIEVTGKTCRFRSQAEAEAHYDAAALTTYQLWQALMAR